MSFSHSTFLSRIRFRFWDPGRYTAAETAEMCQLHEFYGVHLSRWVPIQQTALAIRTEGAFEYPKLLEIPRPVHTPAITTPQPLRPFATTLLGILRVYLHRRSQRWYREGYSNDPNSLFCSMLQEKFRNWLSTARCEQATLDHVIDLRRFLEAIQCKQIFHHEPSNHTSMTVLLHNLVNVLRLLEEQLQYQLGLQSTRERLGQLKAHLVQSLDHAVQYLFYAVTDQQRATLSFSSLTLMAGVLDQELEHSLQTREGVLLKHLISHPMMVSAFLSEQIPVRRSKELLKGIPLAPFLMPTGQLHPDWSQFLCQEKTFESQLSAEGKALRVGICDALLVKNQEEKKNSDHSTVMMKWIRLQGLVITLATYHHYVQQCFELTGFAGDQLVYGHLGKAIVTLFTECHDFIDAFQKEIQGFHRELTAAYASALKKNKHTVWQKNYQHTIPEEADWIKELAQCLFLLKQMIDQMADVRMETQKFESARVACQTFQGAQFFLDEARQQIGLSPRKEYPGILNALPQREAHTAPLCADFDHLFIILFPHRPDLVAELSTMCMATPKHPPFEIFRGMYRRHCYLFPAERLLNLGQDLLLLQVNASQRANNPLVVRIRQQLQSEMSRIDLLSCGLWWPFHRSSQRFFENCKMVFQEKLNQLPEISQSAALDSSDILDQLQPEKKSRKKMVLECKQSPLQTVWEAAQQLSSTKQREQWREWQIQQFGKPLFDLLGQPQVIVEEADVASIQERIFSFVMADMTERTHQIQSNQSMIRESLVQLSGIRS